MATEPKCQIFDLNKLLHPAEAFAHPADVIADPDLTRSEKRAILSSWASDACALEAAPELRQLHSGKVVLFGDIIDALRSLDCEREPLEKYRKLVRQRRVFGRPGNHDHHNSSLC